jgi:hypothetical protein
MRGKNEFSTKLPYICERRYDLCRAQDRSATQTGNDMTKNGEDHSRVESDDAKTPTFLLARALSRQLNDPSECITDIRDYDCDGYTDQQ